MDVLLAGGCRPRRAQDPRAPREARALTLARRATLALAVVLGTSGCNGGRAEPQWLVQGRAPVEPTGDYPLHPEHWAEPSVAELRRREGLDAVVEGAADEIELFARLTSWASAQWPASDPDPYPPCNAIAILDAIRAGRTGGFCAQYAFVLQDALKSFGYWAVRVVEIESVEGAGHVVVEVFWNEGGRWVVLDPMFDVHHVDAAGRPMSALDLHAACWAGSEVRWVRGTAPLRAGQRIEDRPRGGVANFARIAVALRSDLAQLDDPLTMQARERMFLRYDSPHQAGRRFEHLDFLLASSREADLWPAMGQVFLLGARQEAGGTRMELSTKGTWPHLRGYEIRVGGGAWLEVPGPAPLVPVTSGLVECRAVNVGGVRGPTFAVRSGVP